MDNSTFNYTYSAREQDEIKNIRQKYMPRTEDKMELLRRLDKSVTQKANAVAIAVGIIGALILGTGMSCAMVWEDTLLIPGIIIGVIGLGVTAAAYPLYTRIVKNEREKVAPEIIRLSDELMK